MDTYPDVAPQGTGTWEQCLCYPLFCKKSILYVQRCAENPELWRVAITPGEEGWLVAAARPLCPFCGGILLKKASFEEDAAYLSRTERRG